MTPSAASHLGYIAGAFAMAFVLCAIELLLLYRRSRAASRLPYGER